MTGVKVARMKPGRKPKPKGANETNIVRMVDGKPMEVIEPSGHGDCDFPSHLEDFLRPIWAEIVNLVPRGILTGSDRLIVELAVRNMFIMRSGVDLSCQRSTELRRCLAELGCTPSSRANFAVLKPKESNPYAEFGGVVNEG